MKLKVNKDKRKVRKFFLRTQQDRAALINAIVRAQGYNSQLEQYTIKADIERTQESRVMVAIHNALGTKVVIKAIPSELYHTKAASFSISEVDA